MSRKHYFDKLSPRWDEMIDMSRVLFRLRLGLAHLGIGFNEHILDLGCGTGNLSLCLLEILGSPGRIHAVDISQGMLEYAKRKLTDPRVRFHRAAAEELPLESSSLDRVICFSTWPHITEPDRTFDELHRVLKANGCLHIWHIDSRETINSIHTKAGEAVTSDLLQPASLLAEAMVKHDFVIQTIIDDKYQYLISARAAAD